MSDQLAYRWGRACARFGALFVVVAGCAGQNGEEGGSGAPVEGPAAIEASEATGSAGQGSLTLRDRGDRVRALHAFLTRVGYFPNRELERYPGWRPLIEHAPAQDDVFDRDTREALLRFQRAQGLAETGELDDRTRATIALPRCGVPDYYSVRGMRMTNGLDPAEAVSGYRWAKSTLTFSIRNYMDDMSQEATRRAIIGALDRWSGVVPLWFREQGGADINISFERGDHGDGNNFDGVGRVLAHAFYPSDGRVHFDDDERWSDGPSGADLASVAIHELGHTIGLDHDPDDRSVMFSAYSRPNRELTPRDARAAQDVYGLREIAWSSAGPIGGRYCTQIHEGSDPDTWQDNYLCTPSDYGIRWSSAGPIGGMRCTQITEGSEPPEHRWEDNFLCVPANSNWHFAWSSAGPIGGKTCTQWDEGSDGDTWLDNYLCY